MPIYVYTCAACGKTVELLRGFTERDEAVTCACGAVPERKVTAPQPFFGGPAGSNRRVYDKR